jgi:serine/threonine-protein kinase
MDEQRFQDYRLLQRLSRSASGDLYRVAPAQGTHQLLLQRFPLALPVEKLAQDLRWLSRPVASLGRPAVSRIVASGQGDDGNLYVAFENAPGQPLQALIPAAPEALEPAVALTFVGQIAHVLERGLKAGLIHKLLLPHYLFVQDGQAPTILGLDLPATLADGLLDFLPEEELVFLSPEQRQGNVIDGRSNIYSLGALLYSLLTGEAPLPAGTDGRSHAPLGERRPDLAQATVRLVETCLQSNSWMRFQTYGALRNAIDQATRIESPSATTAAVTYPVAPLAGRRRPHLRKSMAPLLVVALLFVVTAALAVALGGSAWLIFGGEAMSEMAEIEMLTATPTRLSPLEGSGGGATVSPVPPGPTPTLMATSMAQSGTAGGAAANALATPTRRAQPTASRVVGEDLIGDNGESDATTPTATSPSRSGTPRPTASPTTAGAPQPIATATSQPPTATNEPPPLPPPPTATNEPPPPTATSPPPPTATNEPPPPTATSPPPATLPPPTPTPPLPTTS